jgi:hypothetical protein
MDLTNPAEIKTIRAMLMEAAKGYEVADGLQFGEARRKAIREIAKMIQVSPETLENALAADLRRIKAKINALPKFEADNDDGKPEFYKDYSDDTPQENIRHLASQLKGVNAGEAIACLFNTPEEADEYKKLVPAAVKILGWKNRRNNPGYYVEIIQVGKHFKLRIKRLR